MASKLLLAVVTCHASKYTDKVPAQRDTWLPLLPAEIDYKVFYGSGGTREPLPDEVFLDCSDAYNDLPYKLKAIMEWALERGYDFIFKVDDDVYIWPDRLMESFKGYDYMGRVNGDYISGPTYWLSEKAMRILLPEPIDDWAEDRWIGKILRRHGIPHSYEPRYSWLSDIMTLDERISICDLTGEWDYRKFHRFRREGSWRKLLTTLVNPTREQIEKVTTPFTLVATDRVDLTDAFIGGLMLLLDQPEYEVAGGVHEDGSRAGLINISQDTELFNWEYNIIRFQPVEFVSDYFLVRTEFIKQHPWTEWREWFTSICCDDYIVVVTPDCVAKRKGPDCSGPSTETQLLTD